MKLTCKNPFHAKACALAVTSIALLTVAASDAAPNDVKVFDKNVSGVAAANTEIITDNVLSPEFAAGLMLEASIYSRIRLAQSRDSGTSAMAVALRRMKTLILFSIIIRVGPLSTTIMAGISFFRDMKCLTEILIALTSRESILMWRVPTTASRF
jgi:hypothetical protein